MDKSLEDYLRLFLATFLEDPLIPNWEIESENVFVWKRDYYDIIVYKTLREDEAGITYKISFIFKDKFAFLDRRSISDEFEPEQKIEYLFKNIQNAYLSGLKQKLEDDLFLLQEI